MLVYVLDEWILFTVFCSKFSEPWCFDVIFDAKNICIWPHHRWCGQLYRRLSNFRGHWWFTIVWFYHDVWYWHAFQKVLTQTTFVEKTRLDDMYDWYMNARSLLLEKLVTFKTGLKKKKSEKKSIQNPHLLPDTIWPHQH